MANVIPDDALQIGKRVVTHWEQINVKLGASPLVLKGNYTVANLTADIAVLENKLTNLPDVDNAEGLAQAERNKARPSFKTRLKQFRAAVQSKLGDTGYASELPTQPPTQAAEATFLKCFDDMHSLWSRINTATIAGFTGPLVLAGGYTFAAFSQELAALRTTYNQTRTAIDAATQARKERDESVKVVWERIKQYRKGCIASLEDGSMLLLTVP